MRKFFWLTLILMSTLLFFTACKKVVVDEDKVRELEYTVVDKTLLPEIVKAKIDKEMIDSFKFSYSDGEYIYIAIGYGEQTTADYSVQVVKCYESKEYIVIGTKLVPPGEGDMAATTPTYPFIVIKTEDLSKPVCFK